MNAIAPANLTPTRLAQPSLANALVPTNLNDAMRLAEMMAQGSLVPQHLRNPADCFAVIEQAMRWNMSPFAVAQGMFNVKGKNGYAGALLHAAVEQNAPIVGHIHYTFKGEGDGRSVVVSATLAGEAEPRTVEVRLKDARTSNEWWAKTPDQMLCYHGARVWARRHTPQVIFGAYSREELIDVVDTQEPLPPARGPQIDAAADMVQQRQPDAAPAWHSMSWPICTRRGDCKDYEHLDNWLEEVGQRIAAVQASELPQERKLTLIRAIADANRAAWEGLRERGFGGAVDDAEAIIAAALGVQEDADA